MLVILFSVVSKVQAQSSDAIQSNTIETEVSNELNIKVKRHNNVIKLTPLKVFGFMNPSMELVYERKINERYSTQVMASYLLPNPIFRSNSSLKMNIQGFRVSVTPRYYLKKNALHGKYLGIELDYLKNQYNEEVLFDIHGDESENTYLDTISIHKFNVSLSVVIGYQLQRKK